MHVTRIYVVQETRYSNIAAARRAARPPAGDSPDDVMEITTRFALRTDDGQYFELATDTPVSVFATADDGRIDAILRRLPDDDRQAIELRLRDRDDFPAPLDTDD